MLIAMVNEIYFGSDMQGGACHPLATALQWKWPLVASCSGCWQRGLGRVSSLGCMGAARPEGINPKPL